MTEQDGPPPYERTIGKVTIKRTRRSWTVYTYDRHLSLFRLGFHVKRRRGAIWYHNRLRLHEPSKEPIGKGTRTYEWDRWRTTRPGASAIPGPYRVGLKRFVRFKIGFGGDVGEEFEESRRSRSAEKLQRRDRRNDRNVLLRKLAFEDRLGLNEIRVKLIQHGFGHMSRSQIERAIVRLRR